MNIGIAIKELRKAKGITQEHFAQICDLSRSSLSLIESGTSAPHKNTLERICKALQVPEAILHLYSIESDDVPIDKKDKYDILFPVVKKIILELYH